MNQFIEEKIKELFGKRKDFIDNLHSPSMVTKLNTVAAYDKTVKEVSEALHSAYTKGVEDGCKKEICRVCRKLHEQFDSSHKE